MGDKIEIKTKEDFEKNFIFPKEYEHFTRKENIKNNFLEAKEALSKYKEGRFFVTNNPYEWFLFEIPNKVRILFYPHKTSRANVHTRARNQSSKDTELFVKIKRILIQNNFYFKQKPFGFEPKNRKQKELAEDLNEQWSINEETMGEMAAYHVACEMLDIDPDEGYELLAKYCSD